MLFLVLSVFAFNHHGEPRANDKWDEMSGAWSQSTGFRSSGGVGGGGGIAFIRN